MSGPDTPPAAVVPVAPRRVSMRSTKLSLPVALVVVAAVPLYAASGLPGFPRGFLWAFCVAGVMRLVLGRDGAVLVPRRVWNLVAGSVGAVAIVWWFGRMQLGGAAPLVGLLSVAAIFQALCLLRRLDALGSFLVLMLSSTHAAGTAFLRKDTEALWLTVVYVAALMGTLLLFERQSSLEPRHGPGAGARRLRVLGKRPLPFGVGFRTLATLVCLGFPIGAALYVLAPRGAIRAAISFDGAATEAPVSGAREDARPPRAGGTTVIGPSPDVMAVRFGSVAKVKEDPRPIFEVREPGVPGVPSNVFLRDNVMDVYRHNWGWYTSSALSAGETVHRDADDGSVDYWFPIAEQPPVAAPERRFEIRVLRVERATFNRFYLQPWVRRVLLRRDGRPQQGYAIRELGNHTLALSFPFQSGDVIEAVSAPQPLDGRVLEGRASSAAVSPLPTYVEVPQPIRRQLRRIATAVVGPEQDPWRQAVRLEAWLRSEAFEYSLANPPLDPTNRVLDFLETVRRGNCECYANGLALLLRALGRPARYVRGFWGGDRQESRESLIIRGLHYHAWTELYLEGVGWVPLNPTPPDRRPVDAALTEHGQVERDAVGPAPTPTAPALLEFGSDEHAQLWADIGALVERFVLEPVRFLFRPDSGYAGVLALTLLIGLLWMRGRARAARAAAGGPGASLPPGPYGRALVLLARAGLRRGPSETPREFSASAGRWLPSVAAPLGRLTALYEVQRYGGREGASAGPDGRAALAGVQAALHERERGSAPGRD